MKLNEVLRDCDLTYSTDQAPNLEIEGLSLDSRQVKPNFLFFALKGNQADGHDYLKDAIKRGANFAILEHGDLTREIGIPFAISNNTSKNLSVASSHFYEDPSTKLKLVGITGTNGKSTTTFLVKHLLGDNIKAGILGTLFAETGKERVSLKNTTPDILTLNHLLCEMVKNNQKACAMEVSSHALHQGRIQGLQFGVRVFLNLTQDHLDYHETMENYFECKKSFFTSGSDQGLSLINIDCPYGEKLFQEIGGKKKSFGTKSGADYLATNIEADLEKITFDLKVSEGTFHVTAPLACQFNLYNLLAAIGSAHVLGIPIEEIVSRCGTAERIPGRMESVSNKRGIFVLIDYAHTPDAFLNIFGGVRKVHSGNITCVFGCGGDRDKGKRPLMGQIAADFSDRIFITNDNPRSESPEVIVKDILKGIPGVAQKKCEVILDREEAIQKALLNAKKGDAVLILGKGHEDYQIIGKDTFPFKDREVVQKFLESTYANS